LRRNARATRGGTGRGSPRGPTDVAGLASYCYSPGRAVGDALVVPGLPRVVEVRAGAPAAAPRRGALRARRRGERAMEPRRASSERVRYSPGRG